MKSFLTKIHALSFLCALPALANDVGLHNSSAQPTRADPIDFVDTPIVLAQASTPSNSTLQPDYILTGCKETQSTGNPKSAFRAVDPAGLLEGYLGFRDHRPFSYENVASIKPILLEDTTHGKIISGKTNDSGRTVFRYDPEPNYEGKDKAVFMAEFEGRTYKIVVNFVVSLTVGESPLLPGEQPVCQPPQLIKVNGKPVSGSSSYDLNTIPVTFAYLPGAAVGQTTGTNIALDTNAAGYNWFIDQTPARVAWVSEA